RRLFQNVFDQVDREVRINALVDGTVELADVAHHEQHLVDGSAISHGGSSTSKPIASARVSARATRTFFFFPLRPPSLRWATRLCGSLEPISCAMSSAL